MMSPAASLDFSGKIVLVTGASGGLGAGIARVFAEAGARLALHYKDNRGKAETLRLSLPSPERHFTVHADGCDESSVGRLWEEIARIAGGEAVAALINNAGIYPSGTLLGTDAAAWRAVIDANLTSTHLFTRGAAALMTSGGAIVNIASVEGMRPVIGHAHYSAAKAAVIQYTRAAALELAARGIRVNAVSPGLIQREGLERAWPSGYRRYIKAAPLGRTGLPEEIGFACLFLASPAASWITGANLPVDGGVSVVSPQDPLTPA